jgi:cytochrome c biogenesis protein ResB
MKRLYFSWKYALIIAAILLSLRFVMAFNQRINEMHRLAAQSTRVAATLSQLTQESISLATQIAQATSPAEVEQWAYEKGHMARPGDKVIIPLAPGGATPTPIPPSTPQPIVLSNWKVWLLLFVDETKAQDLLGKP